MRYLELKTFEEEMPREDEPIVCFGDVGCGYYLVISDDLVLSYMEGPSTFYCCKLEDLEGFGRYTRWAYLESTFNIPFDIEDLDDS